MTQIWRAWPVVNWLLPSILLAHGLLSTFGGFTWAGALLIAPFTFFISVVLGGIPRRILRRRGYEAAPAAISILLVINWWSMLAAILIFVDGLSQASTSETIPSIVRAFGNPVIAVSFGRIALNVMLGVAAITWLSILILSIATRSTADGESRSWPAIAAFVVAPILVIAVFVVGATHTSLQKDSSGETASSALARSTADQTAIALQRYDAFQQQLAEVRSLIAADGWMSSPPHGLDSDPDSCAGTASCYTFEWAYTLDQHIDLAPINEQLTRDGWDVTEEPAGVGRRLTALREDGLTVEIFSAEGIELKFDATSNWWWGDGDAIWDVLSDGPFDGVEPGPFTDDEWPPYPH